MPSQMLSMGNVDLQGNMSHFSGVSLWYLSRTVAQVVNSLYAPDMGNAGVVDDACLFCLVWGLLLSMPFNLEIREPHRPVRVQKLPRQHRDSVAHKNWPHPIIGKVEKRTGAMASATGQIKLDNPHCCCNFWWSWFFPSFTTRRWRSIVCIGCCSNFSLLWTRLSVRCVTLPVKQNVTWLSMARAKLLRIFLFALSTYPVKKRAWVPLQRKPVIFSSRIKVQMPEPPCRA